MGKSKFELLNTKGKIVVYDSDGKRNKLQMALYNVHLHFNLTFRMVLNYEMKICM